MSVVEGAEVVVCAICAEAIGTMGLAQRAPSGWLVLDVKHWPGPAGDVLRIRVCGMCILEALGETVRARLQERGGTE